MSTISEVLEKHTRPLAGDERLDSKKMKELMREHDILRNCAAHLLKIEDAIKLAVEVRLKEVTEELSQLRLKQFLSEKQCPVLDAEPFRWRNKEGLPTLALFSVLSLLGPQCRFDYTTMYDRLFPPRVPAGYTGVWNDLKPVMAAELAPQIQRVKQWKRLLPWGIADMAAGMMVVLSSPALAVLALPLVLYGAVCFVSSIVQGYMVFSDGLTLTHSVQWRGLIPEPARVKIAEAQNAGGQVFLLAEVEEWGTTIWQDPLILVSHGEWFYLLGSFEPTTLEDYVAREFAVHQE